MEKRAVLKDNNKHPLKVDFFDKNKILNLKVDRRNGSITPFKANKIANAIKKVGRKDLRIKIRLFSTIILYKGKEKNIYCYKLIPTQT